MRRGIATFTLDSGTCPPWLFRRMVLLGREMARAIVAEYGPDEFVRRISDPVWFQSLGTVLAFDWNASGLTTILTAALKEAIRGEEQDLGLFICGGKGGTSRKTPEEIRTWGERLALPDGNVTSLVYHSRMSAKVDSALVQDGYQLYHHSFFFSLRRGSRQGHIGTWAVVQQGMNAEAQSARRYHWSSDHLEDLVVEPHTAIAADRIGAPALNLTARSSENARRTSVELISGGYRSLMHDIEILRRHSSELSRMIALRIGNEELTMLELAPREFRAHPVMTEDFAKSRYLEKILAALCDQKPERYEAMLAAAGVGAKTIRALALVAELIYGAAPSYKDPARYSFAHGGKDQTPYPVDRATYDRTIETMQEVVRKTRLDDATKAKAVDRLSRSVRSPRLASVVQGMPNAA